MTEGSRKRSVERKDPIIFGWSGLDLLFECLIMKKLFPFTELSSIRRVMNIHNTCLEKIFKNSKNNFIPCFLKTTASIIFLLSRFFAVSFSNVTRKDKHYVSPNERG